jgi:DNA-binding response OmpR family regulator
VLRLLVVEDQKKLLRSLTAGLQQEGYAVLTAADGDDGYRLAVAERPDAVILDLMLPGRDGMRVLRDLRSEGFRQPILILTAKDSVDDRVAGLDSGADDYLVKPFAFAELLARLRALLRRETAGRVMQLQAGDLAMDLVARRVTRGGDAIDLSQREFDLLEYLLRNVDAVVTRDMLARDVWKEREGVLTNVIDVYIRLLRKKIERTQQPPLIHTVRGVGYALRNPEASREPQ